ncbi:MAG: hypothetical protein J7641_09830 [Cyanobacteria bacterium SID2]|nr:hypothetical protein [Cyanobacteria bacterium SID2]MBP0002141.1 hypothetical protein [Cyanobacteria bacterium SBC]
MVKIRRSQTTRHDRLRKAAIQSNKHLNAIIHRCGGTDKEQIAGKDRNTYATVADMNNIAVKGTMAHVIQLTQGVKQTRDAYSDVELARIALLEMLEAQVLEDRKPQGHAEIIRLVDREITNVIPSLLKQTRKSGRR